MRASAEQKREQLQAAIGGLENQRTILGDLAVDAAIEGLRRELNEIAAAVQPGLPLAGERKLVTVMFCDVSGYTALAEKMDPERARDLLNGLFDRLVPVVKKFDGTIDKFVGDEIVALFGAPIAHENDPERACRAALEMMEAVAAFNRTQKTDLGLHFGINTGQVEAGGVGTRERQDYSVMGHAVNVAARLEDASCRGEILIGEQTQRQTAPFFEFERMTLEVKGASAPVTAFRLLRARKVAGPTRGISGLHSPLVGRDGELDVLRKAMSTLQSGRGVVIALLGEAGIGKSRLMAEARKDAGEVSWHEGRAFSHTSGMSYWLVRDLLRDLIGLEDGGAGELEASLLQTRLRQVVGERASRVYPFLARFLELPLEEKVAEATAELTGEALYRQTMEAVTAFVLASAVLKPHMLVCEDLHWTDPSSLRTLGELTKLTSYAPLSILLVCRPDCEAANEFLKTTEKQLGDSFVKICLEPLRPTFSEQLLQNLLEVDQLPQDLKQLILGKTEGNAFFLEEVLRSLIDSGAIGFDSGRAVFRSEPRDIRVPDTVQGVLASRIDRLSPAEKDTLQRAAVLGRVVDESLLSQMASEEMRGERLRSLLEDLVAHEFLLSGYEQAHANGAANKYVFKHALTQEVSYESLLLSRRKQLHRQAAEGIETLWSDKLDEQAAVLGQHFAKAELPEKAVGYLTRAGDRATASYANEEAIAFYRQALDQINPAQDDDSTGRFAGKTVELYERVGDLLQLIGRQGESRDSYAAALGEIESLGHEEKRSKARFYRKVAKTYETQHNCNEALRQYELAEATLGSVSSFASAEWEELIETRLGRIWAHYFNQASDKMSRELSTLRDVVELHGTSRQRADFVHHDVLRRFRQERFVVSDETLTLALQAFELRQEDGDLLLLGHSYFGVGLAHIGRFEPNEAEQRLQAALKIAERTGDLVLLSRSLNYLVVVERLRGDVNAAERAVKRSLPLVTREKMTDYIGIGKATLGWIAWRGGDLKQACAEAEAALEIWSQGTPYPFKWNALWPLIAVAVEREDIPSLAKYSQELLGPSQQPLAPGLATCVTELLHANKTGANEQTLKVAYRAVQLARELKYL